MTLTPEQKADLRTQLNRILGKTITDEQLNAVSNDIEADTQNTRSEQLFTCSRCGKTIKAYGAEGEAFLTENIDSVPKYYHNDLSKCLA